MKILKQLFPSFLMLSALLFVGCDKEKPNQEPEPEQKPVTYTATFKVETISDDFFTLGSSEITYTDKDGKEVKKIVEKSQLPLDIKIEGLNESSALSFNLSYSYFPELKLTKDQYSFGKKITLGLTGSDKSYVGGTVIQITESVNKDKVKSYFDNVTLKEKAYTTTVKKLLKK